MLQRLLTKLSRHLQEDTFRSIERRLRPVLHPQDRVELIGRVAAPLEGSQMRYLVATQHKLRLIDEDRSVPTHLKTVRIFQRDEMADFEIRIASPGKIEVSFGARNEESLVLIKPCFGPLGDSGLDEIRGLLKRWQMMPTITSKT